MTMSSMNQGEQVCRYRGENSTVVDGSDQSQKFRCRAWDSFSRIGVACSCWYAISGLRFLFCAVNLFHQENVTEYAFA
jgi:hypothetical protein